MKTIRISLSSAALAVTVSLWPPLLAEVPQDVEAKHRATHEALMQRRAEAIKKAEEGGNTGLKPLEPGEKIKYDTRPRLGDLFDRSSILSFGGHWTLVPKEAVIHVPAAYRSRVNGVRKGKLIPWAQFLVKNRGWLQTHSVSIPQARGEQPMNPDQVKVYKGSGRVVVAVCHNGPISVKPLKVPDAVAEAGAAK